MINLRFFVVGGTSLRNEIIHFKFYVLGTNSCHPRTELCKLNNGFNFFFCGGVLRQKNKQNTPAGTVAAGNDH